MESKLGRCCIGKSKLAGVMGCTMGYTYMSKRLAYKIMVGYCKRWLVSYKWVAMSDHWSVVLVKKGR